jgi:hypothetical protein
LIEDSDFKGIKIYHNINDIRKYLPIFVLFTVKHVKFDRSIGSIILE